MRKIFDFHGGIHPPENKQQSVRTAIANAGVPPELIVPLSQYSGAPALPVVAVGDHVLKGQLIAEARGVVGAALHAPSSGVIHAIEERLIAHPSGHLALCIVITTDGRDEWIEQRGTPDYQALAKAELIDLIRDAGIVGLGGAGFPSAVKLEVDPGIHIETLIINGAECEPYITADDALMRERAEAVIEGTKILRHILAPRETLIGLEDNKPESFAALCAAAEGSDIEIVRFPTRYPSGGEKQLIELLTGKQVPSGGLPSQIGVICQNVGTAAAIYDAVALGIPLISRITTVTGDSVREPQNFQVLIGTPVRYLLEKAGYQPEKNNRLVMGGSMMGFTIPAAEVPVVKTTLCLLAPSAAELPLPHPAQACIRCGLCAQACPVTLLPQQLFWFAQGKEFAKLEGHNLFDCIECGACSWVCPSNIPLVQYYRAGKAEILQLRERHEKAEQWRLRFEARQQRLERAALEKEAKRAARKQAAAEPHVAPAGAAAVAVADDPIQAAIARVAAKKAARQGGAGASIRTGKENELADLENAVLSAKKRLHIATTKLAEASAQGSDLVDALQHGADRTRSKLAAAEQALLDYRQSHATEAGQLHSSDPAETALAKATAEGAAEAALGPVEKARADLEKWQLRLRKSQDTLAQSIQNGEEEKVIVALEATIARLSEKIRAAEQTLNAAQDT